MPEPWIAEESVPCLDPECGGEMEPEADGDHRYWACTTCGYEGGFQKVESTTTCATGQQDLSGLYVQEAGAGLQPRDLPKSSPIVLGMPGRKPPQ